MTSVTSCPTPLLYFLFVICLSVAGCRQNSGKAATLASASAFVEVLRTELAQAAGEPPLEPGTDSGQTGSVHTRELNWSLPAAKFPPSALAGIGVAAMRKWGQMESYAEQGIEQGGNRFSISYGNDSAHAFIDLIAYQEEDKAWIVVFIRVVE